MFGRINTFIVRTKRDTNTKFFFRNVELLNDLKILKIYYKWSCSYY